MLWKNTWENSSLGERLQRLNMVLTIYISKDYKYLFYVI